MHWVTGAFFVDKKSPQTTGLRVTEVIRDGSPLLPSGLSL